MSDSATSGVRPGRGSYLALTAAAILILAGLAAFPVSSWLMAVIAAFLLLALGGFAAFSGRAAGNAGLPAAPAAPAATAGLRQALSETLDQIGDPILLLDVSGRIVLANRAARGIVGAEAERKHLSAVLRMPELLEAVEDALARSDTRQLGFSIPVPTQRHFEAQIVPGAAAGIPGAAVLIHIRDTTAIRRAEELRADFVANASHELRTPLAAVSGFIDTLRGHARNDPEARERFLEIMNVEASRMRRLIDALLSLARIELNEHNPPSAEVDVVAVVRSIAEGLSSLALSEGMRITVPPHEPLYVIGERDELSQVFQNLIHNAIKYGRPGGEIAIGFARAPGEGRGQGDVVSISVADQGEGIPREAIPRLTERFYRVDIKRSREKGGTGLGLAIVKHILNRHRGRLQIESTPDVGSVFTVFLPAAAASPPLAQPIPEAS